MGYFFTSEQSPSAKGRKASAAGMVARVFVVVSWSLALLGFLDLEQVHDVDLAAVFADGALAE